MNMLVEVKQLYQINWWGKNKVIINKMMVLVISHLAIHH